MRIPSSANTAPLTGIISAKSGQISCARSITARVVGEGVRDDVAERQQHGAEEARRTRRDQPIIRRAAARAPAASPPPSIRPTITCPAIATASSTSAMKTNSWKAIWCAAEGRRADPREHRRADEERRQQRRRAHGDLAADARQRAGSAASRGGSRAARSAGRGRTPRPCRPARSPCPTRSRPGPSRSRRRTAPRGRR